MKKTKKALASLAIAGMTLTMIPFNVFAASPIPTRLSGLTAEQTAVAIADQTGYTGTAILASSTSYGMVDALTAGPLATSLKAPILLTGAGNTLDAATKAELTKLAVKTVYVTSGTAVIKQGVIDELKGMDIEVVALGGFDRAETSVNIAKKMTGVTKVAVANTVVDALSIAAVASAANEPILLTDKDALPASVAAYLASAGVTSSDVIGGTGVISDAVVAGLPSATRHAGMTAYDTNNQVIQDFAAGLAFDNIYVANGVTGIDALAGAPLAAQTKSPIVLTDGSTVPAAAAFTYSKNSSAVVTALGGTAVVPESVRVGVSTGNVTNVPGDLAIVSISALDDSNRFIEVTFNKPVSGLQASDVVIENADTLARYGVKSVQMSSNSLTATIELYASDDSEEVLQYLQDYNVTINAGGTILKSTFNRAYSSKVRVQDINVGDNEIVVYNDKTGEEVTLDIPEALNFDYEATLGELVQVWYNGDNELTNYMIVSPNAKNDSIEVTKATEIKLLSEGKKYDISEEAYTNSNDKFAFYLDGESVNIADHVGEKFNFAKVGFNKSGDIEFVSAYTLRDVLIVDSIEGDEVIGVEGSASAGSFDAKDATIIKDGKVIDVANLTAGDLLFFNNDADDDDGYAEVLNNKVATGEIDNVYSDSIEVGGETYNFDYDADVAADFAYSQQAVYIDENGEVTDVDSDAAEELQAGGEVALYTDYAGNLIFISGDTTNVDSNSEVAVLTEDILGYASSREKVEIEAVTESGEDLYFDMELEDLEKITVNGTEYEIDNGGSSDWTASLIGTPGAYTGINLDENGAAGSIDIDIDPVADAGSLVKLHLDDEGNLEEIEFFSSNAGEIGYDVIDAANSLESGDLYLDGFKLTSETLMFDATEDSETTDADDYVLTTFGEYKGAEITNGNYIYNDDQEVVAIWFDQTTSDDLSYEEAVVTKVLRNTDGEVVSVTVYAAGEEKTYTVDEFVSDVAKGDVVILELDKDSNMLVKGIATAGSDIINDTTGEYATRVTPSLEVQTIDVGNKKVTFTNGDTYSLAEGGLVLDGKDNSDIKVKSLSDLRGKTNVTVVKDAKTGSFAKFFVIEN
ncbi:cell wall-binding repeat-containing protein [Desulfosporosinus hippei]|uniref:Putative cell wall-binding protein n=1 Tax=Desulfosporosinus hippei DSM 8344 TaxID=1121419 RepID=A0A1G7U3K1_9FIRM|nr:cell wall-binding repeat-containing protein [Desulfosporosinus hippei]SDG42202.1 Putative cell wall-binding protein [Desulfosporosinus hippei DSM 8344]